MTRRTLLAAMISTAFMAVAARGAERPMTYNRDVRPLLSDRCFRCHGPDAAHREADLRLDRREDAVADRDGSPAIVVGKPAESALFQRITAHGDERMPPADSTSTLSPAEIDVLRRWIEQGAEYEPHWAFVPPRRPDVPKVAGQAWVRNPIDAFVLAELERRRLAPSQATDKATLLRRASLDLTGLPPTLAELDAFLADERADAYERAVDRLLASPRFGERMALDWLDAARYADTNGYYNDSERQAWPWRDWVIRAFNANKPFDEFTIEQLAGDLLPNATLEQRIATGFNRNHMVTNETGIIDEEYRVGYVVDRVDTTSTVWLGLTVGCARCHDHKYDPITQREYYGLFAYFNSIDETGLVKDVAPLSPAPNVALPTAEQERRLAELKARRAECEAAFKQAKPTLARDVAKWEPRALDKLPPLPTVGEAFRFSFDDHGRDDGPRAIAAGTVGKLAFEPGVRGRGATFDSTQYVEFDKGPSVRHDRPFSLSVWIKPGGAPSGCVVSKMDATAQARGFEIIWYKSQPRINFVHEWGRDAIEVVAKQKFGGKQWRHLAVTYDGSGRAAGMQVYVDGELAETDVRHDRLTGSTDSAEPWRIAWKGTGVGFDGGLDELRFYERELDSHEIDTLYWRELLAGAVATPPAERTSQQIEQLQAYYIAHYGGDELRRLSQQVAAVRAEEDGVQKSILSVSVMRELDAPRTTHVLVRGQYDQPGEMVTAGVPAALGSLTTKGCSDRLEFARWLVAPENPLTARVAVNRLWRQLFGEGLVRTDGDFGLQGEQPTHPELLDWLAVRFVESGWDVKQLLKLIATSATYRQSSNFTSELLAADPENRLLARGPRYRLPAELIRDQALAVSGLLVERLGGPSVKPYQPPGLWEAVSYNGEQSYEADRGEGLYRRGLYSYWKRQSPPPGILTFDGPTREVCTVRRARTNTPLQALVLLNDVTYVEAARALAARILREASDDPAERCRHGFRLATGRIPDADEVAALVKLYERQAAEYRARSDAARELLDVGESPVDPRLDAREWAAWSVVAGVLLNLDEVVTQH